MKRSITLVLSLLLCGLLCAPLFSQDVLSNTTGKTVIKRNARDRSLGTRFLIISKSGTVILLDPYTVSKDVVDPKKVDGVFITHGHYDHVSPALQNAVMAAGGKLVQFQPGQYKVKDVVVTGIPSSHASDDIQAERPSNVLYLIEVDGLRIVHMGDIGQTTLTADQMKALGKVDIALMQFANSYSNMSVENAKGFTLMEQLSPTVIIPTHTSPDANAKLEKDYGGIESIQDVWAVSPADLSSGKKRVINLK